MSNITSQPSSPAEWKEYATSDALAGIPLKEAHSQNEPGKIATYRDVYLDGSTLLKTPKDRMTLYADILAFTEQETIISPPTYGVIQIVARVVTADAPVHLNVLPVAGSACGILLYASVFNQPVTVSSGASETTTLELGPGTENVGVDMAFTKDHVEVSYQKRYYIDNHQEYQANLQTQLRIALALFWRNTSIAVSLCSHAAAVTAKSDQYPLLNAQAVALGQQLAAQAMTGPDTSYAPVLVIDEYMDTMEKALVAVAAFETQYNRFQDKELSLQDQIQAWDVMLQQAIDEKNMRAGLRDAAHDKYKDASKTASNCILQLDVDNGELERANVAFELGLARWQYQQRMKAVFRILGAIINFAVSIGQICVVGFGGGAAAKGIDKAVDAVKGAEAIADQVGKQVSSETLKKLGDCMKALEKIFPAIDATVNAVEALETDPTAAIPPTDDISGSSQGDADAAEIVALAAWDRWVVESDQQMEFAVGQNIEGASEYRLVLRKHAINGKLLAQAQAEAIKAGQQYVQAEMEVVLCKRDIESLQELKDQYQGEDLIYAEAEAKFFDRLMALRTSLVIEMRNLVWAYKYYALADSKVDLDSQKSVGDYQQDLYTIRREIQNADEQYASDFQYFTYDVRSSQLPSNYGQMILEGIKGPDHKASFTLAPTTDPTDEQSFASVFTDGFHYRLEGLEATLRGAMPQPGAVQDGVVLVVLQITTSGIYSDIQDGKIFHFTSLPQIRRFSYDLKETGEIGETRDHAIFETKNHEEPTPFTQWTIKLLYPERVNLDSITGVDLQWSGHVRYNETRH